MEKIIQLGKKSWSNAISLNVPSPSTALKLFWMMTVYVMNIFLLFCTVNRCLTGFRCQSSMDFFIDLNRIKKDKSRKVFSFSSHLQIISNSAVKWNDPTNPTNPTWNGLKIKNTFRDFATFTGRKFKWWWLNWLRYIFLFFCSLNSSIDIFETGFRHKSCISYVFMINRYIVRVCKIRNNDYSLHIAYRKC